MDDVKEWLGERFAADEIVDGWTTHLKREPYAVPAGYRPVGVWWD